MPGYRPALDTAPTVDALQAQFPCPVDRAAEITRWVPVLGTLPSELAQERIACLRAARSEPLKHTLEYLAGKVGVHFTRICQLTGPRARRTAKAVAA